MSIDPAVRDRLALNLDFPSLSEASAVADRLAPWFGIVKVGFELFIAEGPATVEKFRAAGFKVFLDIKLHDIPNTVANGARAAGRLGATYVNMHTLGGVEMIRAGVHGLAEGAAIAGVDTPVPIGVTVLTSDKIADPAEVERRMIIGRDGGCGGFVCAAAEIGVANRIAPGLITIIPGIRLPGADTHDQGRPATPDEALRAGADIILLGRTVTGSTNPETAAQQAYDLAASVLL
ncbi:MAG: orotidine-5'-phosphate decarboxylase [Actinobacteria bacterium]|nr:orotidine-5'-phosphate decarboxylase [Actinomycetota bacterium]